MLSNSISSIASKVLRMIHNLV